MFDHALKGHDLPRRPTPVFIMTQCPEPQNEKGGTAGRLLSVVN